MNARALMLVVVALLVPSACAVPASDRRIEAMVPNRESFAEVAQVLVHECGTLDCHGSAYRNLRIYGNEGLRFASSDRPLMPSCTTDEEVEQDYQSVVGLEPEIMTQVTADGGSDPERLTLIRKARGIEHHKGGAPIRTDDEADRCLITWLAGATDRAACARAIPPSLCF